MRRIEINATGLGRAAVLGGLAAVLGLGGLGGLQSLRAATGCQSQCLSANWHAVETANFRILSFGPLTDGGSTAKTCEQEREKLARRWLPRAGADNWSPKCELVLHPSDDAYLLEVGQGARQTLGSALVERKEGRVVRRRIDIRATRPAWQTTVLAHELTHVMLADCFEETLLPRWIDEGAAILADPAEKRTLHLADLKRAMARRGEFRVLELIMLTDYPPPGRWGTFYAQSASLVGFLVEQGGEAQFIDFVQAALAHGYERALRQVYRFGVAELERRWHNHFRAAPGTASDQPIASRGSSGRAAVVRPISLPNP